ncbi:MAG: RagB/SusD family nutrient uptake outer membrane protein [Paludibacteraceae bacterium]|nr:RagB/SusD family nutrient uptake outer membrane protein [Bacteroidia bacterium]HRG02883.1 RagB/SusD family nutrient uptake outer membrane protein [Paludibacteraceae bacterium]
MKHFKIFSIITFCLTLLLVGCEKDLNVLPQDKMSKDDFLAEPLYAVEVVNSAYNQMLSFEMYGFPWIGVTSITSDDADKGSSDGDAGTDKDKLDNLAFDKSLRSFNDVWKRRYEGIYRCNEGIFYLGQVSLEESIKNRYIGELKFLRAMFYFDLVRCFGGVPVVVEKLDFKQEATVNQVVYSRKTKAETYAQIEKDLIDAAASLPLKYNGENIGRATKGAAQGLLAKVYLYQEKWSDAYAMAGNVVTSKMYDLLPDYASVWREVGENGKESLFEIQATLGKGVNGYTDVQSGRGTPDHGWGFNTPTANLANAYEPGDKRKDGTIMFTGQVLWDGFQTPTTGWANPRYNYKAYQSRSQESWDDNKGETAKNVRLLKYSDILLVRAEAAHHINQLDTALSIVNKIRNRAGLIPLTSVTLDQIYKERRLEMAMEHDRWFDIVRTGKASASMSAVGKVFIQGKHELFPIPEEQITLSKGILTQNPNYN